ncbi:MAG: hypothetical protein EAX90_10215 [Candidatus Heimdallarchaeota archaeon]|nr:hypothetical protein [Candidatus Heimdallarchaeota archaeon]
MKENLLKLTENLATAGFEISGMEVEATDLVRIKFHGTDGLELIVNESYAKIIEGNCTSDKLSKIRKLVKQLYKLREESESMEQDMFKKLLNAS